MGIAIDGSAKNVREAEAWITCSCWLYDLWRGAVGNGKGVAEARSLICLAVWRNNNDKYSILGSYWRFYWLELSSALVGSIDTKEDFIRCERKTQRTTELAAKERANRHPVNTIPSALKNTHFQRASFREERRCRTLKEMTLPAVLRLALHENLLTQNGHS